MALKLHLMKDELIENWSKEPSVYLHIDVDFE